MRTFVAREHVEDGCYWADSDQAPGWTAAADSHDELFRLVAETPAFALDWPVGQYNTVLLTRGA